MGSYQNISKSPTTPPPSPLTSQSSQPPLPQKSSFPMLYYGIVVVATATLVLAIYHLIIVRWCTIQYHRHLQQENQLSRRRRNPTTPNNTMLPPSPVLSGGGSAVPSCKYKKGGEGSNKNELDYDTECSVCLSIFEDGEEVKRLPICDHCFHASCIDMWLYAHTHCPLCRAPVVEPPPQGSSSV